MRKKLTTICLISVCLASIANSQTTKPLPLSDKTYTEAYINGEAIKLHYLDWGGSGQPLILIHGLGDSPYIFEDLADDLKNHFRVIAYSRRGHCKSETADTNFDNATLVSDLKLLIDSLKIPRANLLGWSMGGNEITEFAIQHPEKTNKLIYFESGYDLSEKSFSALLNALKKSPFPHSSDLSSIESYRKWYHSFWFPDVVWNSTLESNLQASLYVNSDGSITTIPNDELSKTILKAAMSYQRNYNRITSPALVFYTSRFFQAAVNDSVTAAIYDKLEREIISQWRQTNMDRIKSEFKNAKIQTLANGTHASFIFLSKDEVVKAIKSFLLE